MPLERQLLLVIDEVFEYQVQHSRQQELYSELYLHYCEFLAYADIICDHDNEVMIVEYVEYNNDPLVKIVIALYGMKQQIIV
ncbi:unnamed protein product [Acanthoscelides obtectus]|uniref:Uncharacterized protein n=1 Tax=Acanthoscelides obtectus TaxID=200917 RepID=A0A9P0L5W5_ACAOB|nr:unnamed protein product [Acanthoscelides obtectus]CAK1641817.1 hypothetical protein AOBTE_LOCUS12654 [Acanthoscelides obtectus]